MRVRKAAAMILREIGLRLVLLAIALDEEHAIALRDAMKQRQKNVRRAARILYSTVEYGGLCTPAANREEIVRLVNSLSSEFNLPEKMRGKVSHA